MKNKNDVIRTINQNMFALNNLYQISQRGIWNDVVDAGMAHANKLADNATMTDEQFKTVMAPIYGNMLAVAGYDD